MKRFRGSGKNNWTSILQLSSPKTPFAKKLSRLAVLESIWKKEVGRMASFWILEAVKGGSVYVKVKTSGANQELDFQRSVLIKSLNKYFTRKWIKQIKSI